MSKTFVVRGNDDYHMFDEGDAIEFIERPDWELTAAWYKHKSDGFTQIVRDEHVVPMGDDDA